MSYVFAGVSFPESDAYDTVCKWCAKSFEFKADIGSSGTNTSSSSDGNDNVVGCSAEL